MVSPDYSFQFLFSIGSKHFDSVDIQCDEKRYISIYSISAFQSHASHSGAWRTRASRHRYECNTPKLNCRIEHK